MLLAECLAQCGYHGLHQLGKDEVLGNNELLAAEREQLLTYTSGALRRRNHVLNIPGLWMLGTQSLEHKVSVS